MSRTRTPALTEAGFTLLETLIAAAIIAAMTGVTYEAAASTARIEREVRDRRQATLVAQSLLAQLGVTLALEPGATTGTDGAFSWVVEIDPYGGGDSTRGMGPALVAAHVSVSRPGTARPLVRLSTLKIGQS